MPGIDNQTLTITCMMRCILHARLARLQPIQIHNRSHAKRCDCDYLLVVETGGQSYWGSAADAMDQKLRARQSSDGSCRSSSSSESEFRTSAGRRRFLPAGPAVSGGLLSKNGSLSSGRSFPSAILVIRCTRCLYGDTKTSLLQMGMHRLGSAISQKWAVPWLCHNITKTVLEKPS